MRIEALATFVEHREQIRVARGLGAPAPWTDDAILQKYRFCNVRREHDAVTRWLADNWRDPHADDPDLWYAMVVARHVNNVPALAELPYPSPWDEDAFLRVVDDRKRRKVNVFGAAYMISTNGIPAVCKARHLCERVFWPLWEGRATLRPRPGDTLTSYHATLGQLYGLASFLAAQVVADVKYYAPLLGASDWLTFAASGPGSRRGMNRVLDRGVDDAWREDDWRLAMGRLRPALLARLGDGPLQDVLSDLHAQDVQNCLCEFDKYERARLGQGRPKQLFRAGAGA